MGTIAISTGLTVKSCHDSAVWVAPPLIRMGTIQKQALIILSLQCHIVSALNGFVINSEIQPGFDAGAGHSATVAVVVGTAASGSVGDATTGVGVSTAGGLLTPAVVLGAGVASASSSSDDA